MTDKEAGRKIRSRRMSMKLTQLGLAKRLRLAQSRLSYLERGLSAASRKELKVLARVLAVPIETLVFETEDSAESCAS